MDDRQLDTLALHAGALDPRPEGAVVTPIFQSANFLQADADPDEGVTYARLSNTPTHDALHGKLAALENAPAALATASGMAAISAALFSQLRSGDHLLIPDCLYGGTHMLAYEAVQKGRAAEWHTYPMAHSVHPEQIAHLRDWLHARLAALEPNP